MTFDKIKNIIWNAILAYEDELEQQGYDSPEELHKVVLNEFEMTEDEYQEVMGHPYSW